MIMNLQELIQKQREIDKMHFEGLRKSTTELYWCNAIGGEIGEIQNQIKKLARGNAVDGSSGGLKLKIAEECADVLIYAMIIGDVYRMDITKYQKMDVIIEPIDLLYTGATLGVLSGRLQWALLTEQPRNRVTCLLKIIKILFAIADELNVDLIVTTHQKQLKNIERFGNK